jgi:hypothetical protein
MTVDEAATELRKSRRWLLEWLRSHPMDADGQPFYTAGTRFSINQTSRGSSANSGGKFNAAQPQAAAQR